eukprot:106566-Pyramimonas_sp.AAC.1
MQAPQQILLLCCQNPAGAASNMTQRLHESFCPASPPLPADHRSESSAEHLAPNAAQFCPAAT